ncbi:MAG TPA: hypothetical protein G4O07_09450 [Dehalococcoidia bacterium]|nr:hypothetical protein [Dehalococcoidia bacterium]
MAKTKDPFEELRKQPYPLFVAPKAYSFDLNEDMVKMLREEFNADIVSSKLFEAIEGKKKAEIADVAGALFKELGQAWMQKTIQLGEEYSDRTIEIVFESVDRQGNQFMVFPHVPQRFIEIAYLGTQDFMKVPITLNNLEVLEYRIPQCALFRAIKEKCGDEVANLMTCKDYCLSALETVRKHLEMEAIIDMAKSTAADGYCEFSMRKM